MSGAKMSPRLSAHIKSSKSHIKFSQNHIKFSHSHIKFNQILITKIESPHDIIYIKLQLIISALNSTTELTLKKGVIVINNEKISLEELENDAIEFGAEDVEQFDEFFTLTCAPNDFSDVLCKLKEKYQIEHSKVEQVPKIYVEVSKRDKGFLKLLIQALESNPSVLAVYHNADF